MYAVYHHSSLRDMIVRKEFQGNERTTALYVVLITRSVRLLQCNTPFLKKSFECN